MTCIGAVSLFLFTTVSFRVPPQLTFERLTVDDGLSHNSVRCLVQDDTGYLWLGTSYGLNRFDGQHIVTYKSDLDENHALLTNSINALAIGENNALWVGTDKGLYVSSDRTPRRRQFQKIALGDTPVEISTLCVDSRGDVWVGSNRGLWLTNGSETELIEETWSGEDFVRAIVEYESAIWVGNSQGLFRLAHGQRDFEKLDLHLTDRFGVTRLQVIQGELWVGTKHKLWRTSDSEKTFHLEIDRHKLKVTHMNGFVVNEDAIWIGTIEGLYRVDKQSREISVYHYDGVTDGSIGANYIRDLAILDDGSIYIATSPGGVSRIIRERPAFEMLLESPTKDRLINDSFVLAVSQAFDHLWVGSLYDGLRLIEKDRSIRIWPSQGRRSVITICESQDGVWVWFGTTRGALGAHRQTHDLRFVPGIDLTVWAIAEDQNNQIWIGSEIGLFRFDPKLEQTTQIVGVDGSVSAIIETQDREVWTVGKFGVVNVRSEDANNVNHTQFAELEGLRFVDIVETTDGNIWVAGDEGLWLLDPDSGDVFNYSARYPDLVDLQFVSLVEDGVGAVWAGTSKGLLRIDFGNESFRFFDADDGLVGIDFSPTTASMAHDGRLLFGGVNGICHFPSGNFRDNSQPVQAAIVGVNVAGRSILDDDDYWKLSSKNEWTIRLPYDRQGLSIQFSALDYQFHRNLFRYKLGSRSDWQVLGEHTFAHFPELEPGHYDFLVSTSNRSGVWSDAPAKLKIIVDPPFWKSVWFRSSVAIIVSFVIFGVIFLNRRAKLRIEMAALATKRQAAADFHDHLGHQLTRMSMLSSIALDKLENRSQLEFLLNQIQSTSRRIYSESRDFIWSLLPGMHSLHDVAEHLEDFAVDLFEATDFELRMAIPEHALDFVSISSEQRRHLCLFVKEALHNALRHSHGEHVTLFLSVEECQVMAVIEDDGQGFNSNKVAGIGLTNLRQRSQALTGSSDIETSDRGTRVRLRFPIT